MPYHLQFRRYRLSLRTTVRTAHEVWTERVGIIVRLADEQGRAGFGEIAPIAAFGTETIEQADAACRAVGEWPNAAQLQAVPTTLGCVRSALNAALADLARAGGKSDTGAAEGAAVDESAGASRSTRGIAGWLPAGRDAIAQVTVKAEAGFRVFKWKVGVGDIAEELALLDDVCGNLPRGGKLRLDANGAWDRRKAERWLERCAERPIEFVEQPCFATKASGETAFRRAEDTLLGLAHDFPTPIGLDESLINEGDVTRWIANGWPGWFVIKPSLIGDLANSLAQLSSAKATVVFSSALETAVGAKAGLRAAFAWSGEPKALGFGVWPLFSDYRCDGPAAAAFLREEDVERLDPEAVWNALT